MNDRKTDELLTEISDQALVSELMNRIDAKDLLQRHEAQELLVELFGFALGTVEEAIRIDASVDAAAGYRFKVQFK
jgi:hypothetical protein